MKKIIDKKVSRTYWQLEHWYEKAGYIIGMIYIILFTLSFIVGFVTALAQ